MMCLQASFVGHYCRIAARKLLFFHGHNNAVRVRDLLTSPLLQVWRKESRQINA